MKVCCFHHPSYVLFKGQDVVQQDTQVFGRQAGANGVIANGHKRDGMSVCLRWLGFSILQSIHSFTSAIHDLIWDIADVLELELAQSNVMYNCVSPAYK